MLQDYRVPFPPPVLPADAVSWQHRSLPATPSPLSSAMAALSEAANHAFRGFMQAPPEVAHDIELVHMARSTVYVPSRYPVME